MEVEVVDNDVVEVVGSIDVAVVVDEIHCSKGGDIGPLQNSYVMKFDH